jgi:hypothetical protein
MTIIMNVQYCTQKLKFLLRSVQTRLADNIFFLPDVQQQRIQPRVHLSAQIFWAVASQKCI